MTEEDRVDPHAAEFTDLLRVDDAHAESCRGHEPEEYRDGNAHQSARTQRCQWELGTVSHCLQQDDRHDPAEAKTHHRGNPDSCAAPGYPLSGIQTFPWLVKRCGSITMDTMTRPTARTAR